MDNESKITYSVIAILIIFLGGLAYILRPTSVPVDPTVGFATSTTSQPLTTNTTLKAATTSSSTATTTKPMEQAIFTKATITTNMGVIEVELAKDKPITTKNFGTLAQSKFYDGVRFHRVIKDFMIQTGDPLSKDISQASAWGTGGPGYKFQDELTGDEKYLEGTLAMANSGPNTNGSQFFIVTAKPGYPLPPNYTVFGKITKGIDVARKIQNVKTGPSDRPLEDVIVQKIEAK